MKIWASARNIKKLASAAWKNYILETLCVRVRADLPAGVIHFLKLRRCTDVIRLQYTRDRMNPGGCLGKKCDMQEEGMVAGEMNAI